MHMCVRSLDCRLKWFQGCVGVGVMWSPVLWAEGARRRAERRPEERARERGLLQGVNFPHTPHPFQQHVCLCVRRACCSGIVFSFPQCSSISQFHLGFHSPHPIHTHTHPSSCCCPPASLCSAERATDPLGGQINSPVRAAQSAEGLGCKRSNYLSYQHSHRTQRWHIHTPPAFTH